VPVAFLVMTGVMTLVDPDLFGVGFTNSAMPKRPSGLRRRPLLRLFLYLLPRTAYSALCFFFAGYMAVPSPRNLRVGDPIS